MVPRVSIVYAIQATLETESIVTKHVASPPAQPILTVSTLLQEPTAGAIPNITMLQMRVD